MKLTIVGRFVATGFSISFLGRRGLTGSQRIGRKSRLFKCCGEVHQIEELYRDLDSFEQWRGINEYICTKCHARAKLE